MSRIRAGNDPCAGADDELTEEDEEEPIPSDAEEQHNRFVDDAADEETVGDDRASNDGLVQTTLPFVTTF